MVETLEKDGHRIDRASQVILRALNGDDEWVRGKTLREAADLSQNGQVFYRMEEHLLPAGLAQEAARTERDGHVEPRQFRLTEEGAGWVEEHAEALAIPTTLEETATKAGEAYEAAESARSSVQNYRKKLYRVKSRVDDLEELPERVRETETKLQYQAGSLDEIRSQTSEIDEAHEELRETVERQHEEIESLVEENAMLQERAEQLERKLERTVRQQAEREYDRYEYLMYPHDRWQLVSSVAIGLLLFAVPFYFLVVGEYVSVMLSGMFGGMVYNLVVEPRLRFSPWPRFSS